MPNRDDQRIESKNCGLLVSVRDLDEAKIAVAANVSIIDVKEPNSGSLGCVSFDVAQQIVASIPPEIATSIALGEANAWPPWPGFNSALVQKTLGRFDFIKIGLAGMATNSNWQKQWNGCFEQIPQHVQKVAVAYTDYQLARAPSPREILSSATEAGCSVLLLDTLTKGQGSVFDFLADDQLRVIFAEARELGLKTVIAGSLHEQNIEAALKFAPDFIAVRGAACATCRTSTIQKAKVDKLVRTVSRFETHAN